MMNYEISEVSKDQFLEVFDKYSDHIFGEDHSYDLQNILSKTETENIKSLGKCYQGEYRLHLLAFNDQNEPIGWSFGFQQNAHEYYMCNSAVLPEFRKQGVYTALLEKNLEILKEKGFQKINSRHTTTNNAILIPKLKAGFIINRMEVDDIFGVLLNLTYYTNSKRKKVMDYRVGEIAPDDELKEIFNI